MTSFNPELNNLMFEEESEEPKADVLGTAKKQPSFQGRIISGNENKWLKQAVKKPVKVRV